MRFVDNIHKRLYRISKINTRFAKDKKDNEYEVCNLKTKSYIIYCVDLGNRFGYVIESIALKKEIFKNIAHEEPKTLKNEVECENKVWIKEFEELEKTLEQTIKKFEEYESKLLTIANEISAKI